MRRCFFIITKILFLTLCFNFQLSNAQEYSVEVKAGKLKSVLKSKGHAQKLKITGSINGNDLEYLRNCSYLEELDLKDVLIVSGGKYKGQLDTGKDVKYKLENDSILPVRIFYNKFPYLKKIILPKDLKAIAEYALHFSSSNVTIQFSGKYPPAIDLQKFFCDTIIAPAKQFQQYKTSLEFAMTTDGFCADPILDFRELVKDSAPEDCVLILNDQSNLRDTFEGAYSYPKKLKLIGNIKNENLKEISKLGNLELLDLSEAHILDSLFIVFMESQTKNDPIKITDEKLDFYQEMLQKITPIDLSAYFKKKKELDNLIRNKTLLETDLKNLPTRKEQQEKAKFEHELLSLLVGLSNDVLEQKYDREEVGTDYYISNKVFNEALKDELDKELSKANLTDPEVYKQVEDHLYKSIRLVKDSINTITPQKLSEERKYNDFCYWLQTQSIIPSSAFEGLQKLNTVILPKNTVIIERKAFVGCPLIEWNESDETTIRIDNKTLENLEF